MKPLALLLALCSLPACSLFAGEAWPAKAERIVEGRRFTEGPTWHPDGYLLFSDIPANRIYRWEEGKPLAVFREPSHNSNGLAIDPKGRLIACEHGARRVSRTEADGSITVLAERYQGKRLNSPNDLTLHSDGSIYFTDPPYGLRGQKSELGFQGVYRIAPDGALQLLVKDMHRPNGIALSPDEKHLYIGDSAKKILNVHEVKADGTVGPGRLLADLGKEVGTRVIDGIAMDVQGNIYATCTAAVTVVSPKGKVLAQIACPTPKRKINATNCCFGGAERKTLFITAGPNVFRAAAPIPGRVVK
jgi:gluconolactonase